MKTKNITWYFVILFCLIQTNLLSQKSIIVKQRSGTNTPFVLSGIRKITFSAGNLNVIKTDVTTSSFALTGVRNLITDIVPLTPTIGSSSVSGISGTATVSFTAPVSNGSSAITSYTAYSNPGNISGTLNQSGSGTITITGLTNGTAYTFSVKANNVAGASQASGNSNSVTPYSVPGVPTNVIATAGNTKVSVSFSAPVDNGGSAITNYTITSNPGNITSSGTSSPLVINGLSNGTTYTFTVTATNTYGTGVGATSSSVTPDPTANIITVSTNCNVSTLSLTPVSDVLVSSGSTLTLNSSVNINSIVVSPTSKLTLNSGQTFSCGTFTLQSDNTGTGTLMDSYETPTINATVKQYVTAGRNWYMSVPLNNTADYSVLDKGATAAEYNETTGLWTTLTSGTLTRGKGYVQVASHTQGTTGTVSFSGTTNSGDVPVILTYTSDKGKGFNLVGNPYPSYLSWSAVAADNAAANMPTGTMWYRTVNYNGKSPWAPNTAYNQNDIVYNSNRFFKATTAGTSAASGGPTGSGTGISDGSVIWNYEGSVYMFATISGSGVASPATVSNLVPPMQAFWVKSNGGTLTFKNAMRSHNTGGTNALKAPKNSASEMQLIRLKVTNGASADEAVIYTNINASNVFDIYDAPKYFNTASNQPEIYTQAGNEKLVINAMNEITPGTEIALGFATEKENDFTISATEWKNQNSDMQIVLKDKQLNREFDLTTGQPYAFSSVVVNNSERFRLIFRAQGSISSIENPNKINIQVFVNAANQVCIIAPEKCKFGIYNAVGQKMYEGISTSNYQISSCKLKNGVYVVRVTGNGKEITTKVIVK